jgi:hypothetical protein
LACALLEPGSEKEWGFLRRCALNQYDDRWVDRGAIQTLQLIASPRSLQILKEVQQQNVYRAGAAAKALDYVQSGPPALRGEKLEELAVRVADVIRIGKWEGNRNTRYSESGNKALIDFAYFTGGDVLIYTATFHRVDGLWRLRGVRETLQQFAPPVVVIPARHPPVLLPPLELGTVPSAVPAALDWLLTPVMPPSPSKDVPTDPKKE